MSDVVTLEQTQTLSAQIAQAQAAAYVWGRQDAGESAKDTGFSWNFATAYRDKRVRFDTGQTFFMPCLERAFKEWRETGKIA